MRKNDNDRFDPKTVQTLFMRFLFPHPLILWIIVVSAAALLALCLSGTVRAPGVLYFSYHYSTYALVIFCAWLPGAFRHSRARLDRFAAKYGNFGGLYDFLWDMELRTRTTLVPFLIFNLTYAVFKLASGLWLRSWWLFGMGMYYAILAAMRFSLLFTFYFRNGREDITADWRAYRGTARWLLGLTLVMAGLIVQMLLKGNAYHYPGVLIYAFALYAFIKIISAVSALIRHRHGENRLLAASRCISFACALMSMLALQTALIDRFGTPRFATTANALLGSAVCAIMLGMCTFMLSRAKSHIR